MMVGGGEKDVVVKSVSDQKNCLHTLHYEVRYVIHRIVGRATASQPARIRSRSLRLSPTDLPARIDCA